MQCLQGILNRKVADNELDNSEKKQKEQRVIVNVERL